MHMLASDILGCLGNQHILAITRLNKCMKHFNILYAISQIESAHNVKRVYAGGVFLFTSTTEINQQILNRV